MLRQQLEEMQDEPTTTTMKTTTTVQPLKLAVQRNQYQKEVSWSPSVYCTGHYDGNQSPENKQYILECARLERNVAFCQSPKEEEEELEEMNLQKQMKQQAQTQMGQQQQPTTQS